MTRLLAALADDLSRRHARAHVVPTGNATSALYLAFKALGLRGRAVAVPNSVCVNVPIAVLLSGNHPIFVDIDETDLGLSPDRLEEVSEPLGAVVAIHAYGMPCRIDRLEAICRRLSVPLIEDFALAQGAVVKGRPVGSFGDVSCVSFGAGKIVSCGGGGALLTSDRGLSEVLREAEAALPARSDARSEGVDRLLREYRRLYNDWVDRDLNGFWREFTAQAASLGDNFRCRFPEGLAERIVNQLGRLDENLASRARRAERLRDCLKSAGSAGTPLIPPSGSVYWRQNLLLPEGRNRVLKSLLEKKFKVSSWYGPADLFFRPREARTLRYDVSDRIGATILNLWVNEETDDAYAPAIAGELARLTGAGR